MGFWFCWVLILFTIVSAEPAPSPRYNFHHDSLSFDSAATACSPGNLTTLATKQEVDRVLRLVSELTLLQNRVTFWVGLRKVKDECVVSTLPLRGFKWTQDGSEDSQVSRWAEEPLHTCTTMRCAALRVEWDELAVTEWGLIPISCRSSHQYICKYTDTGGKPAPQPSPKPEPAPAASGPAPKPTPAAPESAEPEATPQPKPPKPTPERTPATQPEPKTPTGGPKPDPDLKSKTGPELHKPDPDLMPSSDPCKHPLIPGARSFSLQSARNNNSRIRVECWSTVTLELHCSGRPTAWRLLDDSPANFSAVCQPCESGFHKDASGNCEDIDECGAGACKHICLNTEGSYRCFCLDENGNEHDEDSPACAATGWILILVLVAVATLVVVVVTVMVKCCLMRRSKKRAMKKAEKMAMKSKDGFQTANEKAAT